MVAMRSSPISPSMPHCGIELGYQLRARSATARFDNFIAECLPASRNMAGAPWTARIPSLAHPVPVLNMLPFRCQSPCVQLRDIHSGTSIAWSAKWARQGRAWSEVRHRM